MIIIGKKCMFKFANENDHITTTKHVHKSAIKPVNNLEGVDLSLDLLILGKGLLQAVFGVKRLF
ncbi:hypothetical protein MAR_027491 [Mya arenaria]|uniref:Uncharacterized protein n=1 Tax=Mya arenaria TaxID=6604 RepID=A0ABY7EX73_MYAAR|nr:hypothetical protein MAR_027491 [Mya arenaria]